MANSLFYYDIEVFPNFFSCLLITEDMSTEYIFYKYKDRNDIPAMVQFLSQENLTLVGFNSLHYDDPILKLIMSKPEMTNRQIFNCSKRIITNKVTDGMKKVMWSPTPWRSGDMMALLESNMNRPSLKHCAIHLEHKKLQDLPKSPEENVKPDEVETILKYNRNDVLITSMIWNHTKVQEAIELRLGLEKIYHVDLLSANDSKIGNIVLEAEYGKPDRKGTRREIIRGTDLIPPTLEFKTDVMLEVKNTIEKLTLVEYETEKGVKTHLTYPRRKKFEHVFEFNGITFKMAKGGLHSDDPPRILRTTKDIIIRDADVGSYYPSMGHEYGLVPAHLDFEKFMRVRKELIDRRLAGKHSGDKVTADGLKITINGMFGKMNYEGFWLYDPLPFYQTTIYGQLLLLMLIEMLYLNGIKCVSANTDGIVCEIPRDKEDVYFETCIEWQKKTRMSLEYTDYNFLVQLNVNSYMSDAVREGVHDSNWNIVWKDKDDIKTKKDFSDNKYLVKQSFVKGYQAPITAIALQNYYKHGIPVEETVYNEKNIHNFLFTVKTARKFKLIKRWANGKEEDLQKTNRYYVTNGGYVLVKKDKTEYTLKDEYDEFMDGEYYEEQTSKVSRETSIWKGNYTCVLNDITDERPKVNRKFYIDKVNEIIEKIEPPKVTTIFDFLN